jgi:hypothetical protein
MAEMTLERGLEVLDRRTRRVRWWIYAYYVTSLLTVAGAAAEFSGTADLDAETPDALSALIGLFYLAFFIVMITCIVLVARWIYRAHANLRAAGVEGCEITPGWAVGWYFIPFANLFKPFQAMRELWNASHAQGGGHASDSDPKLNLWWGFWIVGSILSNISFRLSLERADGFANVAAALDVISTLLLVVAAWFLLQIVTAVNAAQRSMVGLATTFA